MNPIPWTYVRAELGREPLAAMGLGAGLFGAISILGTCWAIPRLPEGVLTVLSLSLAVEGLPALVLVNTLLAVWFVAYFVGAIPSSASPLQTGRGQRSVPKTMPTWCGFLDVPQ